MIMVTMLGPNFSIGALSRSLRFSSWNSVDLGAAGLFDRGYIVTSGTEQQRMAESSWRAQIL